MFRSITKKAFVDLLKNSENELIFSRLNLSESQKANPKKSYPLLLIFFNED